MGSRGTAIGAPPAGGGRTLHAFWPDFNNVSGNPPTNGSGRAGTGLGVANVVASVTQGVPPATTVNNYRGRFCWELSSAAGGAGFAMWFVHTFNPQRDAVVYPAGLDDEAAIEVRWLLAFDRPAGDLGDSLDLGVGVSPGNNNQNTFNPAVGAVYRAGVQFGPGGPGKIRFRSRPGQTVVGPPPYNTGLGFDTGNVARAGFDEREWHWYGIRIVGGSQGGAGVCKAMLDGVAVSSFDMSVAGNIFPGLNAGVGGVAGLRLGVTNASNATFDKMRVARGELIAAPDESQL